MSYLAIPITVSAIGLLRVQRNRSRRVLKGRFLAERLIALGLWLVLVATTTLALVSGFDDPVRRATVALIHALSTSSVVAWDRLAVSEPNWTNGLLVLCLGLPLVGTVLLVRGGIRVARRGSQRIHTAEGRSHVLIQLAPVVAKEPTAARLCACGCGRTIPFTSSLRRLYSTDACRRRAARRRAAQRRVSALPLPSLQPADEPSADPGTCTFAPERLAS